MDKVVKNNEESLTSSWILPNITINQYLNTIKHAFTYIKLEKKRSYKNNISFIQYIKQKWDLLYSKK